jgi:DNA-binding NtrC family response regulator
MNRNNGAFHILVVDNDPAVATSLAEILRSSGFSVSPFSNPFSALVAATEQYPHILITVVQIAERSGVELALYLKDRCLDCEALIISGVSCFGNLVERASRLGFQIAFHSKPVDSNVLLGEVIRLVRRNALSETLISNRDPRVDTLLISKRFIHCTNHDGTFRSVCMECFVAVSSNRREEELIEPEQKHICEPWMLETPLARRKRGW